MISVTIFINGQPIITRSARRVEGSPPNECTYHVDDGREITHWYSEGAVALAIELLKGVQEP